jgi:hypothetical protein
MASIDVLQFHFLYPFCSTNKHIVKSNEIIHAKSQ